MLRKVLFAALFACTYLSSTANAVEVTNLIVDPVNQEVTFDIEWQNSWRLDGVSAPNNWDGVWVFIKQSACDSVNQQLFPDWDHGKVSTLVGDHTFSDLEPVLNDGTIGIADSLGVLLRRNATGFYTNNGISTITLSVPSLNPLETYHLRVMAIEMVYVNEDAFSVGGAGNQNSFDSTYITSEAALTITSLAAGANASVDLAANFPKGFAAFHCMKYEVSQGQYSDFLNSVNSAQAFSRFANTAANRHTITAGNGLQFENYAASRENRANNYMSWDDLLSYLDWAALRPMSEMEYEKACRGPGGSSGLDYAWGSTYINNGQQFTGAENGTEYFIDATANCVYTNNVFVAGDAGRGPARCGIFALPTNTTREQSGATYYGIMEMSGNTWEFCVAANLNTDIAGTMVFDGSYGDGYLDAAGLWDNPNWPAATGHIIRGGGCTTTGTFLRVASRNYITDAGNRHQAYGSRGIR